MTDAIRKQIIKALAYNKTKEEIKECMNVSDEDIDSITSTEISDEQNYYKEMGYLPWKKNWLMSAPGMEISTGIKSINQA